MEEGSRLWMTPARRESPAEAALGPEDQDQELAQGAEEEDPGQDPTGRVAQGAGQDPRERTAPRKKDLEVEVAPRAETSQGLPRMRGREAEVAPETGT